ncbi:MAG: flagellar FliJ family protein [Anaerolineaceae bacterium]|nr:flagellar FliJ family protein [Anaerolineaceae bacterium]
MAPKFTLQSILDYHHSRVEKFEIELGYLNAQRTRLQELINLLLYKKDEFLEELRNLHTGELDLLAIRQVKSNVEVLEKTIEQRMQDLYQIEVKIEEKRKEILAAKQDEAVMDKLKEKEIKKYDLKIEAYEKRQQDDIYTSKTNMKMQMSKASLDKGGY